MTKIGNDCDWEEVVEEHAHLCGLCNSEWRHVDEMCQGPAFRGYGLYAPTYDCPMCEETIGERRKP